MKKLKAWWKISGFANIGLLIAALILFVLFREWQFFKEAGIALTFLWLGLNWQAAKDASNADEEFMKLYDKVEDKAQEAYDKATDFAEAKAKEAERKLKELEEKLKEYINEKVKPFK